MGRLGSYTVAAPHRISRRAVLAGGIAGLLAGCTPPGLPDPLTPSGSDIPAPALGNGSVLTVGVDGPVTGLNPYLIADIGLLTHITASLLWPSVSVTDLAGRSSLNTDLITAAAVMSDDPFVVSYSVNTRAAWSDGTPITAEDFRYLHRQLTTVNGTVGAAPYRLIDQIESADAGKTVTVAFKRRYPQWRRLFSPLLPAHILKDTAGGFHGSLAISRQISGGWYRLEDVDTMTGQLDVQRNDKYWAVGPSLAHIAVRMGGGSELAAALARGDLHALVAPLSQAAETPLTSATKRVVPLPWVCTLVLSATGPVATELAVRQAIELALDRPALIQALGAGQASQMLVATSPFTLPVLDHGQTAPITDPDAARALLATAGYRHGSGVYLVNRDGQVLRLTLAFAADRGEHAVLAGHIRDQLASVGFEINLLRLPTAELIAGGFTDKPITDPGRSELKLIDLPRSPSEVVTAGTAFSCPEPERAADEQSWAGNLSRWCTRNTSRQLAALLSTDQQRMPADLADYLTEQTTQIPLAQPTAIFAAASSVAAASTGSAFTDATSNPEHRVLLGTNPVPLGWIWQSPLMGVGGWTHAGG